MSKFEQEMNFKILLQNNVLLLCLVWLQGATAWSTFHIHLREPQPSLLLQLLRPGASENSVELILCLLSHKHYALVCDKHTNL